MTMLMDGASQALTTDTGTYTTPEALWDLLGGTSSIFEAVGGSGIPGPIVGLSMRGVTRVATTGGMILGASTADIAVGLYRLTSGVTMSALVNTLENSLGREWQDWLAEPGAGSLQLMNDDTDLASIVGDGNDLALFKYRGQNAFMVLLEDFEKTTRSRDEEAQQRTIWGGRGHLALLERMLVYPSGGVGRVPIQEDRYFNWAALEYVDTLWAGASVITSVATAQTIWGGGGNTWDADFPDPTALVLGPSSGSPITAPVGDNYLRQDFTVPASGKYGLYALADNVAAFYIDGQLVLTVGQGIEMTAFQQTTSDAVELSAGTHIMAIRLTNNALAGGNNPTGVAWSLHTPGELGETGTLIAHSDASARIVEYPAEAPGMTPGEALWIPIAENIADGYLTGLTRTWTDLVDSNGDPWPVSADIATKVGTDVLTFGRELSTYLELDMTPGALELNAYNIGGKGSVKAVTLAVNVNLESLVHRGEVNTINTLLARYFPGWSDRSDAASVAAYGKSAALISVGALDSLDELNRVLDAQLALFAEPREMIEAGVVPSSAAEEPYLIYRTGDSLTAPLSDGTSSAQRLQTITMSEDGDRVLITLTLRDVILDADTRFAQQVKKMDNGAGLGRFRGAQPAAFNPS